VIKADNYLIFFWDINKKIFKFTLLLWIVVNPNYFEFLTLTPPLAGFFYPPSCCDRPFCLMQRSRAVTFTQNQLENRGKIF
jgi:hypothetical protein